MIYAFRRPAGLLIMLAVLALLPAAAGRGEPLSPERVVEEIRWKGLYSGDEARALVLAVAIMYQDELARAVLEAARPLRAELAGLEAINRELIAGLPPGRPAGGDGTARTAHTARGPAEDPERVQRRLRIWRVVGIAAVVVGVVEAALLLGR